MWLALAVQCICLVGAAFVDNREAKLVTEAEEEQRQRISSLAQERAWKQQSEQQSALQGFRDFLAELPECPLKLVGWAMCTVQALQLRVHEDSMHDMVKIQSLKSTTAQHIHFRIEAVAKGRILSRESDFHMDRFLEGSFWRRACWLLMASHPFVLVMTFSLRFSRTARTLLVIIKLMATAACSALVYQSTGALSANTPPACSAEKDEFREIVRSVITGILTSLLSDGILMLLIVVRGEQCPEVAVLEEEDPAEAEGKLDRERLKAFARLLTFWGIAILYTLLSCYVTICFLANVGHADAVGFVTAFFVAVFKEFVLFPVAWAVFIASVCSLVLCCQKDATSKIREEQMLHTAGIGQSAEQDDGLGVRESTSRLINVLPRASGSEPMPSSARPSGEREARANSLELEQASKSMHKQLASWESQMSELPGQVREGAA
eukprot:TRINITY_DN12544_c0_g1_i9.p1 TRINITY_DN12544_c0_g1~~TRINITY_DN12544_c0_g1_i9.p1  ORF type:complete len:436 (-),score=76.66 TRINITY_DN12544_c0_g1_i9:73-1380(-)